MDVELSIEEEDVGMNNSITEEVNKDERGDEMDSLKEEEIWRSRRERMDKASKAARTAVGQDPVEVSEAAVKLAGVTDVEEFISTVESLANRTDLSAVLNTQEGPWNYSLLHHTAQARRDDILRLLLVYVGDHLIAAQDDWGNTPLHDVAKQDGGSTRAAKMLIRRARELPNVEDENQILRTKNKRGDTALHVAVQSGNINVVRYLLSQDLEPVYWKNASQKSPLYLALTAEDPIPEVLFSLSLEPSRIEGLPPIHGAILFPERELAALVLQKNMKLFAMTDSKGGNVFHLASHMNLPQVFELLGPKTNYLAQQRDMNGDLPIHIASRMGFVDLIDKLNPVSRRLNEQGQTILHVAAKYGRASAVRHILRDPELRYQLNAADHAGNTALHLAAMYSQPAALIPLLRDEEIDLHVSNNKCLTAVDIARECMAGGCNIRAVGKMSNKYFIYQLS